MILKLLNVALSTVLNEIGGLGFLSFGLHPLSGIYWAVKEHVSGTGSVPILRCGVGAPILWGPLEKARLNHWRLALSNTPHSRCPCPTPKDGNRSSS
jgi:DNA mismatch repair protein MutH